LYIVAPLNARESADVADQYYRFLERAMAIKAIQGNGFVKGNEERGEG